MENKKGNKSTDNSIEPSVLQSYNAATKRSGRSPSVALSSMSHREYISLREVFQGAKHEKGRGKQAYALKNKSRGKTDDKEKNQTAIFCC
jgi:hypothetical protein